MSEPEPTCEHGTALDVHCCNCHGGFLFDSSTCVCRFDPLPSPPAPELDTSDMDDFQRGYALGQRDAHEALNERIEALQRQLDEANSIISNALLRAAHIEGER